MKKLVLSFAALLAFAACSNNNTLQTGNANKQIVNTLYEHFNNHDWVKMASLYAETAEFKDPSLGEGIVVQTREQIVQKYSEMQQVFSDIKDEVIQVYPSDDKHVIVEFVSTGTAPDGSRFKLPICTIFTIENGLITKDYTYYDNFEEQQ